ncbi:pentapeptide repeat-containing protein [Tunicatimonas pelagia]|uniref:pentapeptide repeat-containing protein n=1 Tax=Tunicatimonas pelagia TaxID=931531 RepID=UPI0026659E70|nr:pentapeptide repeat-containing protein [Tunicatimonas pelagia]WKN44517.1 pentapeptide repeat-containing protein [Tunicatimonas pelagia]
MRLLCLPIILFALSALATAGIAQQRVDADEVIRQINEGQTVTYQDVEISGDLDLTNLDTRERTESSEGWFGFGNNDTYESVVEASISFINCTFLGDVIAYYHDDREEDTFIAHFEGDVVFRKCTFREGSEFKYSEFAGESDFSGSVFEEEANFKYAEFSEAPSFAQSVFSDEANFKYAEFPEETNFTAVVFDDEADFKYAEFPRGASFKEAVFNNLANFKYAKFRTPLNMQNVSFNGDEDFKYTKVDGRSFTSYLLNNR